MHLLHDSQPKQRGATFDTTRQYRYSLWRTWEDRGNRATFVLLNPSQANEVDDDPTIRRCMGFARDRGYSSVEIVNLFAYCATQVKTLKKANDPIGFENDAYIQEASQRANLLICAWGNWGSLWGRNLEVMGLLGEVKCGCLGMTRSGHPRHPLYLPKSTNIETYESAFLLGKTAKTSSL
jgi:hypothetical protein